jgi:sialic acid synthase SpsE
MAGTIFYEIYKKGQIPFEWLVPIFNFFISSKINKDGKFNEKNIKIIIPATGIPIKNYDMIIVKKANKNYSSGDIIYLNL